MQIMQSKIHYILKKDDFSGFPIQPKRGDRIFLRGDL